VSHQKGTMTRKEALALVYKFYDRLGFHLYDQQATPEDVVLRDQIWTALQGLQRSIHGEAPCGITNSLCQICYLCYVPIANPFVYLKGEPFSQKGICTECLERLKAEGKIDRIINWETGEVTQC
jgi:hypothetical protein